MATQSPPPTDRAKEQAQEKAQEGAQRAQERLRKQVDQRSTQAGEQVRATADALRTTSRQLREQGQDAPAQAAERVAHHAERVGGYLTESDADRLLRDAEDFGRRQPLVVMGVGIALGFAASRFLKASSRKRYEQSRPFEAAQEPAPLPAEPPAPVVPSSPGGVA